MKNRKHRFVRDDHPPPPHELTDDMVRAMMPNASPDTLALCEVALDPLCPNASRVCKNILLKVKKSNERDIANPENAIGTRDEWPHRGGSRVV